MSSTARRAILPVIMWTVLTLITLFPIYWLVVTSLKVPLDVAQGPFYLPFVDFEPTLEHWDYILFGLGSDIPLPLPHAIRQAFHDFAHFEIYDHFRRVFALDRRRHIRRLLPATSRAGLPGTRPGRVAACATAARARRASRRK